MTTIKDIARMSGYSIGTVSRVINNRADVSEEAREKISEIIRERGYQP
ncbi:MAG: LacI family DNA-binding transcriptional regulator, partial [Butyrivibrio sp.]|nr:LacI family DNA-binding transcriptional regulator [Butyrivibrio sp.]